MGGRRALWCIAVLSLGLGGCGRLGFDSVVGEQGSHDSLHGDANGSEGDDAGSPGQPQPGDGDTSASPGAAQDAGSDAPPAKRADAGVAGVTDIDGGQSALQSDAGSDAGACNSWNSRYCGGGWGGGGWGGGGRGGGFH